MAVFDATQNQVLFSPVSNYYQGKAIRAGLKQQENAIELQNLQIEQTKNELKNAPEDRERMLEMYQLQRQAAETALDNALIENGEKTLSYMAKSLAPITAEATQVALTGDVEGGVKLFNERLQRIKSTFPGPIAEKVKSGAGEDGVYDAAEIGSMKMMLGAWLDRQGVKKTPMKMIVDGEEIQGWQDGAGNYYYSDGQTPVLKPVKPFATGRTEFDPSSDPRTGSQKGADYQANLDEYNASSDVHELISSALPRVQESPGSVGFRGKAAVGAAGILSTLGQDELGAAVAEAVAGNDVEAITAMQTQLQALRGRIIPLVTGEEGKRLSETEREIASRAVGLIDQIQGPADLTKAYPQVIGAMKQLYEEGWATKYRIAKKDKNIDWPYDLNERDDMVELVSEAQQAGVDDASIRRMITRLRQIQGISSE